MASFSATKEERTKILDCNSITAEHLKAFSIKEKFDGKVFSESKENDESDICIKKKVSDDNLFKEENNDELDLSIKEEFCCKCVFKMEFETNWFRETCPLHDW